MFAEVMNIVGDVSDKNCLIIDDLCDTGGTFCKVAEAAQTAEQKCYGGSESWGFVG